MEISTRRTLLSLMACSCLAAPMAAAQEPGKEPKPLELNTASRAQLESLSGLGPALVERLLQTRQQNGFRSWDDLRQRVSGIGLALAQRLSKQGLRVAGEAWGQESSPPAVSASGSTKATPD